MDGPDRGGPGAGGPDEGERDVAPESVDPAGPALVIANEFVDVRVRPVRTRNGLRLEIHSPRRGTTVRLDAMVLDALSAQPPEAFSALLASEPGR